MRGRGRTDDGEGRERGGRLNLITSRHSNHKLTLRSQAGTLITVTDAGCLLQDLRVVIVHVFEHKGDRTPLEALLGSQSCGI